LIAASDRDSESFVGEVHGYQKQGTAYGYTRELVCADALGTRAGSDEVLRVRLGTGSANTRPGAERFLDELTARVAALAPRARSWCAATPASRTRASYYRYRRRHLEEGLDGLELRPRRPPQPMRAVKPFVTPAPRLCCLLNSGVS